MADLLETGEFKRGPGGRPTRQEAERRHRDLLTTTKRLLLERGWDATSIDEISRQSGVAKRFVYARYADKAALFFASILHYRNEWIAATLIPDPLPEDVEDGLILLGRALLDVALTDEALAIARLFISEASRFREQAKVFIENETSNPLEVISRILEFYADRVALDIDDIRLAAETFFMMIVGVPQRLAMLLQREPPEQETRRLRAAVKLFLDGCRRKPDP